MENIIRHSSMISISYSCVLQSWKDIFNITAKEITEMNLVPNSTRSKNLTAV